MKLKISLRTFWILNLAATICLGAYISFVYRQKTVVSSLTEENAIVSYEYEYENLHTPDAYTSAEAPLQWPYNRLDPNLFSSAFEIRAHGTSRAANVIALAGKLPRLRMLDLSNSQLDDVGLLPVVECKQLWGLYLQGTQITDYSIDTIAKLQSLRILNISDTPLAADGVLRLRERLPNTQVFIRRPEKTLK